MSTSQHITPLRKQDYEAIEQAVMETARGRWFLREYANRNRTADTNMLLDAIERIEDALALKAVTVGDLSSELKSDATFEELAAVISNARQEISTIRDELLDGESSDLEDRDPLDATAASADAISVSIFEQARGLQETVYKLRDAGTHQMLCDALDDCASQLMKISQQQDLNARRTAQALHALKQLDQKVSGNSILEDAIDAPQAATRRPEEISSSKSVGELPQVQENAGDNSVIFIQTKTAGNPPHFSTYSTVIKDEISAEGSESEIENKTPLVFIPA